MMPLPENLAELHVGAAVIPRFRRFGVESAELHANVYGLKASDADRAHSARLLADHVAGISQRLPGMTRALTDVCQTSAAAAFDARLEAIAAAMPSSGGTA